MSYGLAAASVLGLAVFAAMVGTGVEVAVLVLVAGQVALYVAVTRRRAPTAALRIVMLWSVQAGATWAVAGAATPASAAVFIAVGLVFAVLGHLVLQYVGRSADAFAEPAGEPKVDTAPLPVTDP